MTSRQKDEFNDAFHVLYGLDFENDLAFWTVFFSGVEMPTLIRTNFSPGRNFSSMAFLCIHLNAEEYGVSLGRAAHLDLGSSR